MKRRDASFNRLMELTALDTSSLAAENVAMQKALAATCVLMTCSKCGRQEYWLEGETRLCRLCVSKEEEC